MQRNTKFRTVFSNKHVILPVIHVENHTQALNNTLIALEEGADGVFLINHSIDCDKLLVCHELVTAEFPSAWIGVNCLDLSPLHVFSYISKRVDGVWVDNAMIDESSDTQPQAEKVISQQVKTGFKGLYFGSVAFKYQRVVKELGPAARKAADYMDVVTTSGPGTGKSAQIDKIRIMKESLGEFPLAIASGITPEKVSDYLPYSDCYLVATGISRTFTELDRDKVRSLVGQVRNYDNTSDKDHTNNRHEIHVGQTSSLKNTDEEGLKRCPQIHEDRSNPDLLSKPYVFSSIKDKKILIVGVGGGCDIISAYSLAEMLKPLNPQKIVYANTKKHLSDNLECISPHIFRVPQEQVALSPYSKTYGSTAIDQSIPRGDDGCPLILKLPSCRTVQCKTLECIDPQCQEGCEGLITELNEMAFDTIISVDTGADSIIEDSTSGPSGRDQRMMNLLKNVNCQRLHIVIAPGCDGETTDSQLKEIMRELNLAKRYLGCFSIEPLIPVMRELAMYLSKKRTPNIIADAWSGYLERGLDGQSLLIPRGVWPEIPKRWLSVALVIDV